MGETEVIVLPSCSSATTACLAAMPTSILFSLFFRMIRFTPRPASRMITFPVSNSSFHGWEFRELGRYKRLIAPMRYEIRSDGDSFRLGINASRDGLAMPQFLVETEMVFLLHIIRASTGQEIRPLAIQMAEPPETDDFSEYAGCPVERGGKNAIVFRAGDMEKPFVSHNEGMWDFFEPELQKRLYEMERDDSFSAKVRSALTELLPGGMGTADDVAAKLGISRRTLQRRLSQENTSFQKQLNGTRELLARHYIQNTDMGSADIAFLLGYQELNSFLRAFGVWTGMSVSEYRSRGEIGIRQ